MEAEPQFRLLDVNFDYPAMQVAMPLVSNNSGVVRCMGTAFAVAPGLAITAYHVVDDWLRFEEETLGYRPSGAVVSVAALQWFNGQFYVWIIDEAYASPTADIAFLRFVRPSWWGDGLGQVKPRCARLSFNPPKVGDKLRVFGFPDSEIRDASLYIRPSASTVSVRNVDIKTTISIRPLSYFEVDGQIEGGMSGGPCFDLDWNVVGVNSKGWDFAGNESPIGYVALLWPAMSTQIDLFKTGDFPAIDLFRDGSSRALGYKRVHAKSDGQTLLATVDPDSLIPMPYSSVAEYLEGSLNFAASNARAALVEARTQIANAYDGSEPIDNNGLNRALRLYFWELDSAIRTALSLAAARLGLTSERPIQWEQLVAQWGKHGADAGTLDELGELGFSWNGVDLFEIRTYADLLRDGIPLVISDVSPDGKVNEIVMLPCWRDGEYVQLPDGLDRFLDSGRRFAQQLLRLSSVPSQV
jgi:hypothetical protein